MKYKVKITYPTVVWFDGKSYHLYPDHEVEFASENDHIKTLIAMGYLEPDTEQDHSQKEVY